MEKLYAENQKFIKSTAFKVGKSTGIESEELECQGNLIFVECFNSYDHTRGCFENYFRSTLMFELFQYTSTLRKQAGGQHNYKNKDKFVPAISAEESFFSQMPDKRETDIEKLTIAEATLESMNRDAKLVVNAIFNEEFPEEFEAIQRSNKSNFKKYLKKNDEYVGIDSKAEVRVKKKWIKNYLKKQGWTHNRIENSFREITLNLMEV